MYCSRFIPHDLEIEAKVVWVLYLDSFDSWQQASPDTASIVIIIFSNGISLISEVTRE